MLTVSFALETARFSRSVTRFGLIERSLQLLPVRRQISQIHLMASSLVNVTYRVVSQSEIDRDVEAVRGAVKESRDVTRSLAGLGPGKGPRRSQPCSQCEREDV